MKTTIVLVDDHTIIRKGLRALLAAQPDMEVVGEASNGLEAVRVCRELSPRVVIMDVAMPHLNGMDATRQIIGDRPDTRVIALSMHSDNQFIEGMLKAGACGYLIKDCMLEDLAQAIQAVLLGQTYLSPKIAGKVVRGYLSGLAGEKETIQRELTHREREILQMIAEGSPTRRIAERLNVSAKTVETHRRNIMEKLDVHSIAELTKYAIRTGLTGLE